MVRVVFVQCLFDHCRILRPVLAGAGERDYAAWGAARACAGNRWPAVP